MAYKLVDWFIQIKLNTWQAGHVDGVGFVSLDRVRYLDDVEIGQEDVGLHVGGIALAPHLSLVRQFETGRINAGRLREYCVWMAVRDVFSGKWKIQVYRLISRQNEGWIREVGRKLKRKGSSHNVYEISKKKPFELKERGNYSVYGSELPQARRFKS